MMKIEMTCPHCGYETTKANYVRHEPSCVYNPVVKAALQAWARDEATIKDGVAYFPNFHVYRAFCSGKAHIPAGQRITKLFGTWEAFRDFVAPDMPTMGKPRKKLSDNWPIETVEDIRRIMAEDGLTYVPPLSEMKDRMRHPYPYQRYGVIEFCWDYDLPTLAVARNKANDGLNAPDPDSIIGLGETEDAAAGYRCPFGKITAERKSWAERLTAHIADETERAREWFRLLGLPQPETLGEMGD